MLLKWPRRRPNGSIWIGKDQMVRLVREKNQKKLNKQIEMAMAARDTNEQKPEHLLFMCVLYSVHFQIYVNYIVRVFDNFRMRKKKIESTVMAPTFAVDNIKHLAHNVTRNAEHDWVNRLWSLCSSI